MTTKYINCIRRLVPLLMFTAAILLCVPTLTHADSYVPPPQFEETLLESEYTSEETSETEIVTEMTDDVGASAQETTDNDVSLGATGTAVLPTDPSGGGSNPSELIVQCSISCSAGEAQLIITGRTHSVKRVDEVGFRNIKIFREDENGIWKLYDTLSDIYSVNAVSCFIDSLSVAVSDGGHFYVSCEHYAKDNDHLSTALNHSGKIVIASVKPSYESSSPITVTQPSQSPIKPVSASQQPTAAAVTSTVSSAYNTTPQEPSVTSVHTSASDKSPQTGVPTTGAWAFLTVSAVCAFVLRKKQC